MEPPYSRRLRAGSRVSRNNDRAITSPVRDTRRQGSTSCINALRCAALHCTFVSDFGRPSYLGVFENSRTLKEIILWKAHQNVCKACIIGNSIVWQYCARSLINLSVSEYYHMPSYAECLKNAPKSYIFFFINAQFNLLAKKQSLLTCCCILRHSV